MSPIRDCERKITESANELRIEQAKEVGTMSLVKSGLEALRYIGNRKVMRNPNPAIDLIKKQPTIVVKDRVAHCDGHKIKALGHPRVYINLDHGVHTCGYCGQTFKRE